MPQNTHKNKHIRILLTVCGILALLIGSAGIFLPLLPTTPFLLLSAACFSAGSQRMYSWLNNNRIFGAYLKNYRAGKGVPVVVKIYTIMLLWISIGLTVIFFTGMVWVKLLLVIVALAVTMHILMIKAKKRK